ncbi:MAG TPA: hypothetical protein VFH54_06190 [Mycobacteriales bacterium]|nr:hypothetical protein [Mycobacteriales bacterium]
MAQFKNISGRDLVVPYLAPGNMTVAANATITVADKDAEGFASQSSNWQAMDSAATNAVNALAGSPIVSVDSPSSIQG